MGTNHQFGQCVATDKMGWQGNIWKITKFKKKNILGIFFLEKNSKLA